MFGPARQCYRAFPRTTTAGILIPTSGGDDYIVNRGRWTIQVRLGIVGSFVGGIL